MVELQYEGRKHVLRQSCFVVVLHGELTCITYNWLVSLPFIGIILRGWICKDTRKYSPRIYPCEDIKLKPLLCQRNLCCAGTLIIPRQCFGNNLINAYIITCKFSKDLFKKKLCKLKSIVAEAHFTKFHTSPASWTLTCYIFKDEWKYDEKTSKIARVSHFDFWGDVWRYLARKE